MGKVYSMIALILVSLTTLAQAGGGPGTIFKHGFEDPPPVVTVNWDGGGDGTFWSDEVNWEGDQLPVNGNAVVINDPANPTVIYDASLGTTHLHSLESTESLTLTGGSLEFNSFSWSTRTLTLNAGTSITVFGAFEGGGGLVDVDGGTLDLIDTASTNVNSGGTLRVSGTGNLFVTNLLVNAGGLLTGDGTVNGTVTLAGGTLAPGESPGRLDVVGDVIYNDGIFEVEIGGTVAGVSHDLLDILGNADFNGGTITFSFVNAFLPNPFQSFSFLDTNFGGGGGDILLDADPAVSFQVEGVATSFEYDVTFSAGIATFEIGADATLGSGQILKGGSQSDVQTGSDFDDILDGGSGDDVLGGSGGNDLLIGGTGNDTLTGGNDNDGFFYDLEEDEGSDTILDFATGDFFAFDFVADVDRPDNDGVPDGVIDINDVVEGFTNDGGGAGANRWIEVRPEIIAN